jgi:hypothetical protein
VKTRHLQLVTQEHSVTPRTRSNVLSPYGRVRAGLITSRITQDRQLTELLNSLESVVHNLNYKSFTVYDTLNTVIEEIRASLLPTATEEAGTNE